MVCLDKRWRRTEQTFTFVFPTVHTSFWDVIFSLSAARPCSEYCHHPEMLRYFHREVKKYVSNIQEQTLAFALFCYCNLKLVLIMCMEGCWRKWSHIIILQMTGMGKENLSVLVNFTHIHTHIVIYNVFGSHAILCFFPTSGPFNSS